jgi:hypothetical protein
MLRSSDRSLALATNFPRRSFCENFPRQPAKINGRLLLGVQDHDITALPAAKLLDALGKPALNAPKYFAAVDVIARAEDAEWLSQATKALARFWQRKNLRKPALNC